MEADGLGTPFLGWILLASIPLLLATCTAFTKVSVVLSGLRLGLGAESLIPWSALLGVAVVVTAVVMAPTVLAILAAMQAHGGLEALRSGPLSGWTPVLEPLRDFLATHAHPSETAFFAQLQGRPPTEPLVLVPAFLVTELTEALHMAVLILVPFVVIDLVAGHAVSLLGLVQFPLSLLTLPLKLLLFLGVGGWDRVIGGLVEGYR